MQQYHIGICEFSFPCWGPIAINMARAAGFDGIQLADAGGLEAGFPFSHAFVRSAYLEAADRAGIALQAMHLHGLFHSHLIDHAPDTQKGSDARKSIRIGIEACAAMQIPTVMITVTEVRSAEQYDNVCGALQYAAALCRDSGVQLSVETDLSPVQWQALRDRIGPGPKLCFDTMNPKVYGLGEPASLIEQYGFETIDHFHVKDCCANARGYFTKYTTPICPIGQGGTGFADSARVIRSHAYRGWIISETFYFFPEFGGQDPIALAAADAKTLRSVFDTD